MFKVLIVDDEPFIREGLKLIIDWEQYGFVACGEANDGEEGLKIIQKLSPDLVITDIKMPEMDGLEFIKRAKNILGSKAHFVILSGYNDFQYALSAIKNGVIDYLLKPIEEDELIEILKKVAKELKAKEIESKIGENDFNTNTSSILKALIDDKVDIHLLNYEDEEFSNIFNLQKRYVQVEINILEWFETLAEVELQSKLNKVIEIVYRVIHKENSNCLLNNNYGEYGIILSENILKYYNGNIKIFANSLFDEITNVLKCGCLIIVGKEINKLSDLKSSYESCIETKYYNHFYYDNNVIYYDKIKKIEYNYSYNENFSVEKFIGAIESKDKNSIISIINEILSNMNSKQVAPEIVRAFFMIFISKVITSISKKYGDIDDFMNNSTNLLRLEGS